MRWFWDILSIQAGAGQLVTRYSKPGVSNLLLSGSIPSVPLLSDIRLGHHTRGCSILRSCCEEWEGHTVSILKAAYKPRCYSERTSALRNLLPHFHSSQIGFRRTEFDSVSL